MNATTSEQTVRAREPVIAVTPRPATCYDVRNGSAWAYIFVRHGVAKMHDGSPRYWVHTAVVSDYGSFGYCWSHIGEDWAKFLSSLEMHYAMNKLMGERFKVPLEVYECGRKARQLVLDWRKQQSVTMAEARECREGIVFAERASCGVSDFLRQWDDQASGIPYRHEHWDYGWDKVNPQAEGFWREIWPHFVAAISASAPTVAPEGASRHPVASDGDGAQLASAASGKPTEHIETNPLPRRPE